MRQAAVYFTDFRMKGDQNHESKLRRLMKQAGMEQIDFRGKFVAIKIHSYRSFFRNFSIKCMQRNSE